MLPQMTLLLHTQKTDSPLRVASSSHSCLPNQISCGWSHLTEPVQGHSIPGFRESRNVDLQGEKPSKCRENIQSHSFNKMTATNDKVPYESQIYLFHSHFFSPQTPHSGQPGLVIISHTSYFPVLEYEVYLRTHNDEAKNLVWTQVYSHIPGLPLSHALKSKFKVYFKLFPNTKFSVLAT